MADFGTYEQEGVDRHTLIELAGDVIFHNLFASLYLPGRCALRDHFTLGLPPTKEAMATLPAHKDRNWVLKIWRERQQAYNLSQAVVVEL